MQTSTGLIQEISLRADGQHAAWVSCPTTTLPEPGQYLSAWAHDDPLAPLASILFAGALMEERFLALPPIPATWQPGSRLVLRGPLGRGFNLPEHAPRVALAAPGDSCERLLPLAQQALARGSVIALFTDAPLPPLPAAIEVNPLNSLPEAISWADYLALDLSTAALPRLRHILGLQHGEHLSCPAQALIVVDMPCAGLAACGTCWVPARRGILHACSDGPVFALDQLEW